MTCVASLSAQRRRSGLLAHTGIAVEEGEEAELAGAELERAGDAVEMLERSDLGPAQVVADIARQRPEITAARSAWFVYPCGPDATRAALQSEWRSFDRHAPRAMETIAVSSISG